MATVSYAAAGSGINASGIGWINFGTPFSLTSGSSINNISATFANGYKVTFNMSNTIVSGSNVTLNSATVPNGFSYSPFGRTGYTSLSGYVSLGNTSGFTGTFNITISNISVVDSSNNPVTNYSFIYADAEGTGISESINITTNGTAWSLIQTLPPTSGATTNLTPTLSGAGTTTFTETGVSGTNNFISPIISSTSPTTVTVALTVASGYQYFAIGFAFTQTISGQVQFSPNRVTTNYTGIANVPISLQNTSTNVGMTVLTDSSGNYLFNYVPNGNYIIVEAYGASGTVSSPADFRTATTISSPIEKDPPSTFITNPPTGTTRLDSMSPNMLIVTVNNLPLTAQNFLDGPVADVPISISDVTITGSNIITQGNYGNFGILPAGSPANDVAQSNPFPNMISGFGYQTYGPTDGNVSLTNIVTSPYYGGAWWALTDHTTGDERGRFLLINGANPGSIFFQQILNVTPNSSYLFSTWVANLIKGAGYVAPMLGFGVYDAVTNAQLYYLVSRNIPYNTVPTWYQAGAVIPSGTSGSIKVVFTSEGAAATGNDYAIDDVALVPVTVNNIITATETVSQSIADVGDVLTYTVTVNNTGVSTANSITLVNQLQSNLSFVTGSVKVNNTSYSSYNPTNTGFSIGSLAGGQSATITFNATVTAVQPSTINNTSTINYNFTPSTWIIPISLTRTTNVAITNIVNGTVTATRTVSAAYAKVSDIVTYTTVLKNIGNTNATNVTLNDSLPIGTTLVPNSITVNVNGNIISGQTSLYGINVGTLIPNEIATISFQAVLPSTIPIVNPINSSATISEQYIVSSTRTVTILNAPTNNVTTKINYANLKSSGNFIKSQSKSILDVGYTITYSFSITNTGNVSAQQIIFQDIISSCMVYQSGSLRVNSVPVTLVGAGTNIGSVNAGQTVTVNFNAIVNSIPATNPVTNTGSLSYNYTIDPAYINGGSDTALSNSVSAYIYHADLTTAGNCTKTCNVSVATPGEPITYTISMYNGGNITAENVLFTDSLQSGLTFVPGSVIVNGTSQPSYNLANGIAVGNISAGTTAHVSFAVMVNNNVASIVNNQGVINYQYTVSSSQIVSATAYTNILSLGILKSELTLNVISDRTGVLEGQTVQYTVIATNSGQLNLRNIVLTGAASNVLQYISGGTINGQQVSSNISNGFNIGSLAIGASSTISYSANLIALPANSLVTHEVDGNFNYEGAGSSIVFNGTATGTETIKSYAPGLAVTKTPSVTTVNLNEKFTYTVSCTNNGNINIVNATLTDTFPPAIVVNKLQLDGSVITGNLSAGIEIGSIQIGQTKNLVITAEVLAPIGQSVYNNIISANIDIKPDPNFADVFISYEGQDQIGVNIVGNNIVALTRSVTKSYAKISDVVTYTTVIENTGQVAANNIIFNDSLPSGLSLVANSITINGNVQQGSTTLQGINIGTLSAGQTATVNFSAILPSTIPSVNPITSSSAANYTVYGVPLTANSNTVTTQINYADLKSSGNFILSEDKNILDIGDVITYTSIISNTGNVSAQHVLLTDVLPPSLAYQGNTLTVNGVSVALVGAGTDIGSINAGETVIVQFSAVAISIPASNPISNNANLSYQYTINPSYVNGAADSSISNTVTAYIYHADLQTNGNCIKSCNVSNITAGEIVTFTISMYNSGNIAAQNVMLTDSLQSGLSFVQGSVVVNGTSQPSYNLSQGISIPSIAATTTSTVSFDILAGDTIAELVNNQGQISYNYTVSSSEIVSATAITNMLSVGVLDASLSVNITSNRSGVIEGQDIQYTVVLTNTGELDLQNLDVKGLLSNILSYYDGATINGQTVSGNIQNGFVLSTLPVGESSTIVYIANLVGIASSGDVTNEVQVTYNYEIAGSTMVFSGEEYSSYSINSYAPGLVIRKNPSVTAVNLNESFNYTVTLINVGDIDILDISLQDIFPTQIQINEMKVGNTVVTGNLAAGMSVGRVDIGQTIVVTLNVQVNSLLNSNTFNNVITGTINIKPDINFNNVYIPYEEVDEVGVRIYGSANVTANRTVSNSYAKPLDVITYTTSIQNIGNEEAINVVFHDALPGDGSLVPNSIIVNGSIVQGSSNISNINIGNMQPNEIAIVSFEVTFPMAVPTINPIPSSATVDYSYESASGVVNVQNVHSNTVYTQINYADLKSNGNFVLSQNRDSSDIGDVITYTFNIKNTGSVSAQNVLLRDMLPGSLSYNSGSLTINGVSSNLTGAGTNIGAIDVGATAVVQFTATVISIPISNPIINVGSLTYFYTVNPNNINGVQDTATSNTTLEYIYHADLQSQGNCVKSCNVSVATPGQTITYTISMNNTGNISADNLVINDVLQSGTTFVTNSVKVNGESYPNYNLQNGIPISTIGAGDTSIVQFDVFIENNVAAIVNNVATINYEYTVSTAEIVNAVAQSNLLSIGALKASMTLSISSNRIGIIEGETVRYTVTATNNGDLDLINVNLVAVASALLQYKNNITSGFIIGDLPVGSSSSITFDANLVGVSSNSNVTNVVNGSYNYTIESSPIVFNGEASATHNITSYVPGLSVNKSPSVTTIETNTSFYYTITLKNIGNIEILNIVVKDIFPNAIEVIDIKLNGSSIGGDLSVGISIGPLNIGEEAVLTIFVSAVETLSTSAVASTLYNTITATIDIKPDPNFNDVFISYNATDNVGVKIIGQIGGIVWLDTIGNGIYTPNTPGINNIVVSIFDSKTNFINVIGTTENTNGLTGTFDFHNLQPGYYYLVLSLDSRKYKPTILVLNQVYGNKIYYKTNVSVPISTQDINSIFVPAGLVKVDYMKVILDVNDSVNKTLKNTFYTQLLLEGKLLDIKDLLKD